MMVDLARETWTWRPNPRSPALPMRQYGSFNPGEGLGGAAIHWSGQLWRYLDLHPFTQPSGIASRAFIDKFGNPRGGCLYCGFCTRFGCEVDAKSSPVTTHLPVALATGNYEVRTHAKVLSIDCDSNGNATGVSYLDSHGREHFQPADVVVVSAFTLENNRLLLLSRSKAHPQGIGND